MLKSAFNAALLGLLILCLVSATILFGGILPEYSFVVYGLAALLAVVWALKFFLCRDATFLWSTAQLPVFLFALYAAVSSFRSPIQYESRIELLNVAVYAVVFFLVMSNLHRGRDRVVVIAALVLLALAESIYGFWQYRRHVDSVLWLDHGGAYHGRGSGTYFCPNHLAGLLEMGLAVLIARLLVHRQPNGTLESQFIFKLYETAAVGLIAVGLFATLSRGGWIATGIALIAMLVWAEVARVLTSRFVITVFIGLVLAGIAAWNIPLVKVRIEQEIHFQFDYVPGDSPIQSVSGLSGRYPMWNATTRIIRDHLWLGTGPGTWQWFHPKYREPVMQMHPQFAHNDVLHLASDYGLVGAFLLATFLGLFFWHSGQILRRSEVAEQRAFALGAGTAVIALLVHSFGDFNLHIPANALWLVTLTGLAFAQSSGDHDYRRRELNTAGRFVFGALLLVLGTWIAWSGIRHSLSAQITARGYDASQSFEWEQAEVFFQRAIHLEPDNPEPHAEMADAYRMQSALAESVDEQAERRRLALLSVDAYRQSLALNAFQSDVMLRLASAYELAGDYDGAARTYADSLVVDPNNAFSWLRIGMYYRRRGDTAQAIEALTYSHRLNNIEPIAEQYLNEIKAEQTQNP